MLFEIVGDIAQGDITVVGARYQRGRSAFHLEIGIVAIKLKGFQALDLNIIIIGTVSSFPRFSAECVRTIVWNEAPALPVLLTRILE